MDHAEPVADGAVAAAGDGSQAVFVDLDRTLLRATSGRVLLGALEEAGIGRALPGDGALCALYDRFGESVPAIALARAAALAARGWSSAEVRRAGHQAVGGLVELVAPYAPGRLADFRRRGYRLVLTTATPLDLVQSLADALGFDDVVATRYAERDGRYTGRLDGPFVWGPGKLLAVGRWARRAGVSLGQSHAFSDSAFDVPLLSSVGHAHAVNPDPTLTAVAALRRWPIEHWDRPPGVPSLFGLEPYDLVRPWVRPELFPYARFDVEGVASIPRRGPVLVAANHRSHFDVAALALVAAQLRRPVRFLATCDADDVPVVGWFARACGAIFEDVAGMGSDRSLGRAEAALRAGEAVLVFPQGAIPRGRAFFDPVLHGDASTARLAASTGAPVVPVGLWGTEAVWPRRARVPAVTAIAHPPTVRVRVGEPIVLGLDDPELDTAVVMAAISALLPPQGRVRRTPTAEELARTYPPGTR